MLRVGSTATFTLEIAWFARSACWQPPAKVSTVVITDHNTIAGATLPADRSRNVIVGEIPAQQGELLAACDQEEVPEGLEPKDAIQHLRNQATFIASPRRRMRKATGRFRNFSRSSFGGPRSGPSTPAVTCRFTTPKAEIRRNAHSIGHSWL
jgi:hypothetical protein